MVWLGCCCSSQEFAAVGILSVQRTVQYKYLSFAVYIYSILPTVQYMIYSDGIISPSDVGITAGDGG